MTEHLELPILDRDDLSQEGAAQREFVECMMRGFKFTAHGEWWHYAIGNRRRSVRTDRRFGYDRKY